MKQRIDEVEDGVKKEKRDEVVKWFNEYLLSKEIDFVTFEQTGINVGLSDSKKSLMNKAKAFVDKICDELSLIDTQEYKAEILVEYKRTLNVSKAICDVTERRKAIEEEQRKAEETKRLAEERAKAEQEIEKVAAENSEPSAPVICAPVTVPEEAPTPSPISSTYEANPTPVSTTPANNNGDELIRVHFTVVATRKKLSELKIFLNEGDYNYESK